jgi:Ca2+-transporting ATPase
MLLLIARATFVSIAYGVDPFCPRNLCHIANPRIEHISSGLACQRSWTSENFKSALVILHSASLFNPTPMVVLMTQFEGFDIVANIPGHLRLSFPGLYHSPATQVQLEQVALSHAMVHTAKASTLTGRLLILFDPLIEGEELLGQLDLVRARPGQVERPVPPAARFNESKRGGRKPLYGDWHAHDAEEALAYFASSIERGLSKAEAQVRLGSGANVIPPPAAVSSLQILLNQFKSLPIVLLGVSAAVSALTGGVAEAAAIGAVLVLNGAIGFSTERRAESTVASLSELVDDYVNVLREGSGQRIASSRVVPGDILLLGAGTRIAADLRLVAADDLLVDESALTGESVPVSKNTEPVLGTMALAERRNMAYRGTAVASGQGRGLVVGTGMRTEVGSIQQMTSAALRPKTPVQRQLDQLGSQLIKVSCGMCAAIFGIGLLRGYNRMAMFKSAMSLAIAAVPEGLPAVATTSLARGIHRMRERNVLIRHLHAVETIGAIQTICLDKTGTLTKNQMSAVAVRTLGPEINAQGIDAGLAASLPELQRLLEVCVLCSQSDSHDGQPNGSVQGSATENALLELAAAAGLSPALRETYPIRTSALRAEGRNFMRTVHSAQEGGILVAVKGSPDEVLALCDAALAGGVRSPLDDNLRAIVMAQNDDMAAQQLRVLGFAFAMDSAASARARGAEDHARQTPLVWLGLVGLADPLRPGMERVIQRFHEAGIATVMLTGDQAATAFVIGKQLRLNNGGELNIINSEQLEDVALPDLSKMAAGTHIFSRVTPSHKLRIVQALQEAGQTVAMTGDGINDSPALRAADIGIAMGGGTDVALSAADIALKTDDLETLLEAVGQGRMIADNIRKSIHFLLSSNLSEILLVAGSITAGLGQPLTPLQLLWLNLLTDMLPAIALAAESPEPDLMSRPPRDARRPIVGSDDMWRCAREGGVLAGGAFSAYCYGVLLYGQGERAGTIAFDTLVLGQMLHALYCRSDRHRGLFDSGLPQNRQLMLAIVGSVGLQLVAHLIPGLRRLLGITPLGLGDLAAIVSGAVLPLIFNERTKQNYHSKAATSAMAERSSSFSSAADVMPSTSLSAGNGELPRAL